MKIVLLLFTAMFFPPYIYGSTSLSLDALISWGEVSSKKPVRAWGSGEDIKKNVNIEDLGFRGKILRDEGTALGARGGFAYRTLAIENALNRKARQLDKIRFDPVMLRDGKILPPSLSRSVENLAISEDNRVLRIAGETFHIVNQARFVTVTPTWRNYLQKTPYTFPEIPDNATLPKSANEYVAWKTWVSAGWNDGIKQADTILQLNVAKLRRDIVGMYLYHILLRRGMISDPLMDKRIKQVSGDTDNLIIDDTTFRISVMPKMQIKPDNWRAIQALPELFGNNEN